MISYILYVIISLLLLVLLGMAQSRVTVTLTSNLDQKIGDDVVAYDQQTITFRCAIVTRGTGVHILSWLNDQYIGPGEEALQVTSDQEVGHRVNNSENPTTIATLVNSSIIDPDTHSQSEIVSELHLIASLQHPASSVSCRLNSHGEPQTISFSKADNLIRRGPIYYFKGRNYRDYVSEIKIIHDSTFLNI